MERGDLEYELWPFIFPKSMERKHFGLKETMTVFRVRVYSLLFKESIAMMAS